VVATFQQAAARSNGDSTLERLLRRRRTLGHKATVEQRGPIRFWAEKKRSLSPRAGARTLTLNDYVSYMLRGCLNVLDALRSNAESRERRPQHSNWGEIGPGTR
jgi:hypothetical protein